MNRILRAVLGVLLVASGAWGSDYIFPIAGHTRGLDGSHYAEALAFNASRVPITVEFTGSYARPGATCRQVASIVVQPGEWLNLDRSCNDVYAVMVHTDAPMYVRDLVDSYVSSGVRTCRIPTPETWVPAGASALIRPVEISSLFPSRANLVIINPSAAVLHVSIAVERPESRSARTDTLSVAPFSLSFTPLAALPEPPPDVTGMPLVISGEHTLRVTADGPYYAGVSAWRYGSPVYIEGIALE